MSPLKIILACTLLFFILFFKTNAQVTLSGNAPSYKGEELVFFQFSDLISRTEIPIGRCIVMPDGNFSVDLKIDETEFIFSHLGIYKIYLFAEPGKKYQIVLPENEPKTESQRLNPFFREVEVHVGITNIEKDDLQRAF